MRTKPRLSGRTIAMRCCRAYALLLLCAVTAIASPAQTFTSLFSFDGTDGAYPQRGDWSRPPMGTFTGQRTTGGANGSGCGTVFKITPSGTLTTLHSFADVHGRRHNPTALVQATDGNLYGTTNLGGANGSGTVFKITPSGALTTLYSFCSQIRCMDGRPRSGVIQATDGNFYGTTSVAEPAAFGTVFKSRRGAR